MVLIYAAVGEPLLGAVFGDDLTEASGALPWLGLAMALLACVYLSVQYLLAMGHRRFVGRARRGGRRRGAGAARRRRRPDRHRARAGRTSAGVRVLCVAATPVSLAQWRAPGTGALTLETTLREDALAAVRRYAEEALAPSEFVAGRDDGPRRRPGDRRARARGAGRRLARRLAHRGPLRRALRARVRARRRARPRPAGRLGLAGEPAGAGRRVLAPARAAARAGGRGDHPRAGLRDDDRADLPAGSRAGLRGRGDRHAQPVARRVRRGDRRAHARA